VQHLDAVDRAQALYDLLLTRLGSRVRRSYVSEVGAVVAAHTGPGVIGVCIRRH
jgi:fatty acid-binding protein DegV